MGQNTSLKATTLQHLVWSRDNRHLSGADRKELAAVYWKWRDWHGQEMARDIHRTQGHIPCEPTDVTIDGITI